MAKKKDFDLTIIILNYNASFWLKKTLETLKENYLSKTKYKIKVIVVDNASEDDSIKMLNVSFRWVDEVIALPENLGFAAANNIALKKLNTKYGMLLNNDVEFTDNSNLDLLIDFLEKEENQKVAVITPRLELSNGQLDPACHRGEPTPWASLTYFAKLEALFPKIKLFSQYHQYYKDLSQPHFIDACSGAAMIFRTSALKAVGLMDERFFIYGEDLDWCKSFREHGYKIFFHPFVSLIHHKNKSGIEAKSKQISTRTKSYFYDTMLQYYDKHYKNEYPHWFRKIIKYLLNIKKS